ncbi:DUF4365 domain-containing protein [Actinomadura sp. NPDC048955]|uniref:DUF4365 domain-containing protein n=1 Tax=Actinomadura sp. NPDC048955 TaxID=3158228 RepID=UPI003400EA85
MTDPQLKEAPKREVIRGYPNRYTKMMEQFQESYIRAVAASAGCIIARFEIDDGIDLLLTHKSDRHMGDKVARLEVQLKATSDYVGRDTDFLTATMRRDRWEYYRTKDCTINKIVVIMSMPALQDDWILAGHKALSMHHCAYWVNLHGAKFTNAENPTVRASKDHIFDDIALCEMMVRIGQGGRP